MPAFEYIALDPAGKKKKGVLEGDTARQIRQMLRERQLVPIEVDQVAEKQASASGSRPMFQRGIGAMDMALIMRQLSTLVRSSMPIEEALATVAQQAEKQRVKGMLMAIRSRVLEGHSLAQAMGDFPQAFNEMIRATVDAGEHSAHLDGVLEKLAEYAEDKQETQQNTLLKLLYPVMLVVFAFAIVIFLSNTVVPRVVAVFTDQGRELPWATQLVVGFSNWVQAYGLTALIVGVIGTGALIWVFSKPGPKFRLHQWLLGLPMLGRLIRGMNSARFSHTLSILVGAGVPVLEALKVSGQVVTNLPMKQAIDEGSARVREGVSISKALADSKLFPPMTIHLIANGEASGDLETMLDRAASNQDREIKIAVEGLVRLMEPLSIAFMGILVGFIVWAMLKPIMEMNTLIGS